MPRCTHFLARAVALIAFVVMLAAETAVDAAEALPLTSAGNLKLREVPGERSYLPHRSRLGSPFTPSAQDGSTGAPGVKKGRSSSALPEKCVNMTIDGVHTDDYAIGYTTKQVNPRIGMVTHSAFDADMVGESMADIQTT